MNRKERRRMEKSGEGKALVGGAGDGGKDALTSSASVFRAWVATNPPQDGTLLRFVKDLIRSMEICDRNFEKVLGRMKYVDEFTAGFVEAIQDRMDAVEKFGVVIERLDARLVEMERREDRLMEVVNRASEKIESGDALLTPSEQLKKVDDVVDGESETVRKEGGNEV